MSSSPINPDGTVKRCAVSYTDTNELPTDADMINWVENKRALVAVHHGVGEWKWMLWLLHEENGHGKVVVIEEYGPTWRSVVEAGMRRLP